LLDNTTGGENTVCGAYSLRNNTTGGANVALGFQALQANTTGARNISIGRLAGYKCTTGDENVHIGREAGYNGTTGDYNTGVGGGSLYSLSTGYGNTGIGHATGDGITSGYNNSTFGRGAGGTSSPSGNLTTQSNRICLGNNSVTNAYIKVSWTVTSDERDKADITPMSHGLDVVSGITPINYVWDNRTDYEGGISDGSKKKIGNLRTGFSAQNVKSALDAVGYEGNSVVDSEDLDNLKLTETNLIPFLVNSIKELSAENKALLARIEALETPTA